jgi:3-oxoacyl-[acyl-carrier protein] reductase
MTEEKELQGRVALVTGAAQGIGKATALRLAAAGARLAINDLPESERAGPVVREIQERGGEALLAPADVSDPRAVEAAVAAIIARWGKIDILVNNVGIHRDSFVLNMPVSAWHKVIDTNLESVFLCSKYVLRSMLEQRYGRIINITSVAGIIGNVRRANYSASKGGIIAFTKSLALEVGGRNITVNAIAPGLITTEPTEFLAPEEKAGILAGLSIKRFGKPEEVAELVAFLASDRAAYITSQVVRIDGGFG